jgi:Type IX secretion system protein PorV
MNFSARLLAQHFAQPFAQCYARYCALSIAATVTVFTGLASHSSTVYAQSAGNAAVPFITIGPDARASGMGDVGTGLADDLNAIHWNPAGLAFQYDRQVGLAFSSWLPQFNAGLTYNRGTYAQYVKEVQGTIAVDFLLFNLGDFIKTDIQGRTLGTFRSFEFSIGGAYATQVTDDIGIGVGIKYIQSNLGTTTDAVGGGIGRSVAFDISGMWKPLKLKIADIDMSDRFSLGANLKNLGPSITYNQFSDPLPIQMRLGTAVVLVRDEFNDLTLAVDYAKRLVRRDTVTGQGDQVVPAIFTGWTQPGFELAGGLEYWYDRTIALRAGYFYEPTRQGNRNYFSFGLGVRFDIFDGNFSYIVPTENNNPLAGTLRFSLIVNWRNGKELLNGAKPGLK